MFNLYGSIFEKSRVRFIQHNTIFFSTHQTQPSIVKQQKLFTLSKERRESIKRNCWTELSPDANNFDAKNVADAIKEYSTTTTKCSALNFCIIKYDSSFFQVRYIYYSSSNCLCEIGRRVKTFVDIAIFLSFAVKCETTKIESLNSLHITPLLLMQEQLLCKNVPSFFFLFWIAFTHLVV